MKVFLSWSGEKSRRVASALRDWLPDVINRIEPFMSATDIDAGSRWQMEIAAQLEKTGYGIVCVTHENQHAPWLNFEAGALAKAFESSHVVPLAIDLQLSDIVPPLGHFQGHEADEHGIRKIVYSINAACESPLEETRLDRVFEKWWPDFQTKLRVIEEATPAPAGIKRTERDLLEETLDIVRSLARATNEPTLWADGFSSGRWKLDPTQLIDPAQLIYTGPTGSFNAAWDEFARRRSEGPAEVPSGEEPQDERDRGLGEA